LLSPAIQINFANDSNEAGNRSLHEGTTSNASCENIASQIQTRFLLPPLLLYLMFSAQEKQVYQYKFRNELLMHLSMLSPREGVRAYVGHLIFLKNF